MKSRVIALLLGQLLISLPVDFSKVLIDDLLDKIEIRFAGNAMIMLAVNGIRQWLGVPDNIGGDLD